MNDTLASVKLKVLAHISNVINKALNLEQAMYEVLAILSENLSMKRATITLMDSASGALVISASYGLTPEEQKRGVYQLGEGVTGKIFETARSYIVPDVHNDPLFLDKTGTRKVERGRISFLGVPILLHGKPIGVLNVDRLFDDDVSFDEDVGLLSIVATLIAQFISLNQQVEERVDELRRENVSLRYRVSKESKGPYIVARSPAMLDVERHVERVAPTRATVLLLGESGVGKTLIARVIHDLSDRANFPFVKVNCASIPENLLESELFGFEKGAFTGAANSKAGRFEEAHKGTIFLDEIGELPMGLQAKLLRVLQDREFERLGSNLTRRVDVRIIAATNRDLEESVETGHFRQDLYYRLSVFPIRIPALRERKEDVVGLLNHFLGKVASEYGRQIAFEAGALELLSRYDWPGNVREMENLIERLVIMAESPRIGAHVLTPLLSCAPLGEGHCGHASLGETSHSLKDMERSEVINALKRASWIQYKAAETLGITPRQMGYRVKKFGLEGLIAAERARLR